MLPGDALHRVALVENYRVVVRQKTPTLGSHGKVAKKEGMVDYQNLRIGHTAAGRIVKTAIEGRAFATHAVARIAGQLVPENSARTKRQAR